MLVLEYARVCLAGRMILEIVCYSTSKITVDELEASTNAQHRHTIFKRKGNELFFCSVSFGGKIVNRGNRVAFTRRDVVSS